ncbi:hypothetical protein AMK17_35710 [Streptomyces sp. CB00072]|nr:hypothetical protein AMK17_35710 [Streptomyces sp. CB00072]
MGGLRDLVDVAGGRLVVGVVRFAGGVGREVGGHGVLAFLRSADRDGGRPARTPMCARAEATVGETPLSAV